MKTAKEILESHCESGHQSDWTYLSFEKDVIDGKASHVLAAIKEYADQHNQISKEEYDDVVNEIGQLQEQLKELEAEMRELQRQL